jgi:hypothetical protein
VASLGVAPTYADWLESPWPIEPVEVGAFYAYATGRSLHEVDGHLAISLLVEHEGSATVVLKLTPALEGEARQFLPVCKGSSRTLQDWVRGVRLGDCEVLGGYINDFHKAAMDLGEPPEE